MLPKYDMNVPWGAHSGAYFQVILAYSLLWKRLCLPVDNHLMIYKETVYMLNS